MTTPAVPTPDFDEARWEKSNRSGANGGCVELNDSVPGVIGLRDSKNPEKAPHVFLPYEMDNFLRSVKDGQFDHLLLKSGRVTRSEAGEEEELRPRLRGRG